MGTEGAVDGQWITALDADAELARENPLTPGTGPKGAVVLRLLCLLAATFYLQTLGFKVGRWRGSGLRGCQGREHQERGEPRR